MSPAESSPAPLCYKVLAEDGRAMHGGSGSWHLPKGKRPGKWMPKVANVVPCERGYHLCEGTGDLVHWFGPVIWVAEWRGVRVRHDDKIAVSEARLVSKCEHWNDRTARLFAAACARDVLPIFEKECPNDDRVRKCIEAVERFANGEVDRVFLDAAWDAARAAARAAAWDAARDAAGDAAWAAARAAARAAAGDAAWAAAWDAAGDAARDAARAAARAKQASRLAHLLETGEVIQ